MRKPSPGDTTESVILEIIDTLEHMTKLQEDIVGLIQAQSERIATLEFVLGLKEKNE